MNKPYPERRGVKWDGGRHESQVRWGSYMRQRAQGNQLREIGESKATGKAVKE